MSTETHVYFSGFGHMSHPDDPRYPCCALPPDHPIHTPQEPERRCTCAAVLCGRPHFWSPDRCPRHRVEAS